MIATCKTGILKFFFREEEGSGLVESAVSASLLFMSIFLIFDATKLVYYDHLIGMAARDASRYAMVRGSTFAGASCSTTDTANCDATSQNVTGRVTADIPSITDASVLTVSTSWPGTTVSGSSCQTANGTNSPGCLVEVTVTYSMHTMVPFFPSTLLKLSSFSAVTIQQ